MTPEEWLLVRLDDPPQVFVARGEHGGWQIMVRIDGGYGDKADAGAVAARLGRELRALRNRARRC